METLEGCRTVLRWLASQASKELPEVPLGQVQPTGEASPFVKAVDLVPQNGLDLGLRRRGSDDSSLTDGVRVQPPRRGGRCDPRLTNLMARVDRCIVMITNRFDDLTLLAPRFCLRSFV
jgi:hypothetical protein